MKQVVRIARTEVLELELEVVQPLTRATLEGIVNRAGQLGSPAGGQVLEHRVTEFKVLKATPECECEPASKLARRSKRGKPG